MQASDASVGKKTAAVHTTAAPLLLSVHLPKTGGATMRRYLENTYGDALLIDSTDQPMRHGDWSRPCLAMLSRLRQGVLPDKIRCIHGHYLPMKYAYTQPKARMMVWMRHPIARLVSQYWFWKQRPERRFGAIHRRMHEEDWSLERFVEEPRFWNIYSKYLLFVPLSRFDFVGITERYDASMQAMSRVLGLPAAQDLERRRVSHSGDALRDELTPTLRQRIEFLHRRDLQLYQHALAANDAILAAL